MTFSPLTVRKVTLLLVFFLFFTSPVFAHFGPDDQINFEYVSNSDGLSQVSILNILQDFRGFLWVGTMDGLNRYDGYQFKVYQNNPYDRSSISNNRILSILEDSDSLLWVGTDNGLNLYDRNKDRFTVLNPDHDSTSRAGVLIAALLEYSNNRIWMATSGGIYSYDKARKEFNPLPVPPGYGQMFTKSATPVLYKDVNNTVWLAVESRLYTFDKVIAGWNLVIGDINWPVNSGNELPSITTIFQDHNGRYWLGTDRGLYSFMADDFAAETAHSKRPLKPCLPQVNVSCLSADHDGNLWIGTRHGIYLKNLKSAAVRKIARNIYKKGSLADNHITAFYPDRFGVIWIGTNGRGLNKYLPSKRHFKNILARDEISEIMEDNLIYAISADEKDNLWLGSNIGIIKYNRENHKSINVPCKSPFSKGFKDGRVRVIFRDSNGTLWAGGYQGLCRFDPLKRSFYNIRLNRENQGPEPVVISIKENTDGTLWLGTKGQGLINYDPVSGQSKSFRYEKDQSNSISSDNVFDILPDKDGKLWLATYGGGITYFDPAGQEARVFLHSEQDPNSISSNFTYCLYIDSDTDVWIGTYGAGLNYFDRRQNKFMHIDKNCGLINNLVYGILEDKNGKLWLSTNKGLSRFDKDRFKKSGSCDRSYFRNYDGHDGLQGNEFNFGAYFKDRQGRLYFGGVNGLTCFDPDSLHDNPVVPEIVLTDFRISNESVPIGKNSPLSRQISETKSIVLNYDQNQLSFQFAALHFLNPVKNRYAYKLEGIDKDWIYTDSKRRFANYANLPGGDYVFRVRASNSDGIWNEQGVQLNITIIPPFWSRWWFRLLSLLVLIVTGFAVYHWKVRDVKNKNQRLNQINARLKKEVGERKRAERALRENEEKYRAVFKYSPLGIFHYDKNGVIYNCNDIFIDILGSSREKLIGFNMLSSLQNKDVEKALRDALSKGSGFYEGYYESVTSKKVTPLRVFLRAIYSYSQEIVGGVGIVEDISEHIREQELREVVYQIGHAVNTTVDEKEFYEVLQKQLSKLIDTKNLFIGLYHAESHSLSLPFMIDEKDNFQRISAANTVSALVIKQNKSMLLYEDDIYKLKEAGKIDFVGSVAKSWLGVPLRIGNEVIGIIVVQSYDNKSSFTERDMELLEFVSNQVAVSIRKKRDEEVIRRLSISIDQSQASFIITNSDGQFEYANKSYLSRSGINESDLNKQTLEELFSNELPEEKERILSLLKEGKEWSGELKMSDDSNAPFWELVSISPIRDETGQITNYVVVRENTTELKKLQDQLNQAQKMESIGTLAGGIAHDFNNLLTVINGHSEMALIKLEQNKQIHRDIVSIMHAGKRAETLTRQLLAFSRKQIYNARVLNMNDVIVDLDKMLRRLIGEDIQIQMLLSEVPLKIKADPGQLEQILMNLMINSRDAINEKRKSSDHRLITIETGIFELKDRQLADREEMAPGTYITLAVSDTGIGMTEEVKNKIFEPFFTTKATGKGTGLGMSTVYGIVKQNQAHIKIYSERGKGTTTRIYWPSSNGSVKENVSDHEKPVARARANERILLVEDDPEVRNFAQQALSEQGYEVHTADNGQSALELINEDNLEFNLLVTDMIMPKMNGKELAMQLKNRDEHFRVLYTSGYTESHIVQDGILEEGIHFLHKPYSVRDLTARVRQILDDTPVD